MILEVTSKSQSESQSKSRSQSQSQSQSKAFNQEQIFYNPKRNNICLILMVDLYCYYK